MAHFAELDQNNNVLRVLVVNNENLLDTNGNEDENIGIEFCKSILGQNTYWKQTSYNARFRKNYAGPGFRYDPDLDAFIPPSPYPSWILDLEKCQWQAPKSCPSDGKLYKWDEENLDWVEIIFEMQ